MLIAERNSKKVKKKITNSEYSCMCIEKKAKTG